MAKVEITKSDLHSVYLRSMLLQISINYERFQAIGYLFALSKVLKKLYADDKEKLARAMIRHLEMFNTMPYLSQPIMGTSVAIEEQNANTDDPDMVFELEESVRNVKVGLMGPFAGIGDSIGWMTMMPILASIGAAMALEGSIIGPIFVYISWNIFNVVFKYAGLMIGYSQGTKILADIRNTNIIEKISNGASVLGLMVLGVLVAQWINVTTLLEVTVNGPDGPVVTSIQEVLDGLIPGLLGLGLTMFLVWLLRRKWTSLKVIGLIFVIALVFSVLKIAA